MKSFNMEEKSIKPVKDSWFSFCKAINNSASIQNENTAEREEKTTMGSLNKVLTAGGESKQDESPGA